MIRDRQQQLEDHKRPVVSNDSNSLLMKLEASSSAFTDQGMSIEQKVKRANRQQTILCHCDMVLYPSLHQQYHADAIAPMRRQMSAHAY